MTTTWDDIKLTLLNVAAHTIFAMTTGRSYCSGAQVNISDVTSIVVVTLNMTHLDATETAEACF